MQPRPPPQRCLPLAQPPTALAKHRANGLTYVRSAITSPVCVSASVFAVCLGLGYAGIAGAALALVTVVVLGAMSARHRFVQRYLDHQAQLRMGARRETARIAALRPSSPVRQTQYLELRALVEQIERMDPLEAQRFELQELLDHFVHLADGHRRCSDALRIAGGHDLPVAISITDAGRSKRRREIQARRIRHRDECLCRLERLADELEAVDELVRLVAQRTACPSIGPELEREIERRLWELDEVEAAMEQLSA